MEDGIRESTQRWREVLVALKARGLTAPALASGDGALGFWGGLEEIFPGTRHQRCWGHKTQNVLNALPKSVQPTAKQSLPNIWRAETKGLAEQAFELFLETYALQISQSHGVFAERSGGVAEVLWVSGCPLAESADDQSPRIDLWHHSASNGPHEGVSPETACCT